MRVEEVSISDTYSTSICTCLIRTREAYKSASDIYIVKHKKQVVPGNNHGYAKLFSNVYVTKRSKSLNQGTFIILT